PSGPIQPAARRPRAPHPVRQAPVNAQGMPTPPPQMGMMLRNDELRVSGIVASEEFIFADANHDGQLSLEELQKEQKAITEKVDKGFKTETETGDQGKTAFIRVGAPSRDPKSKIEIVRFLLARKFESNPKTVEVEYGFFDNNSDEVLAWAHIGQVRGAFTFAPDSQAAVLNVEKFNAGEPSVEMKNTAEKSAWWLPDTIAKKGYWLLGLGLLLALGFLAYDSKSQSPQATT
ncbi:MAG: hypothetical protein MK135_14960, partial [Polyangiaceae bacterium]|nr:hypothetical protein [Polyangiaceae bacterium]